MFMPTCVAWLIDLAAFIKANHKLKKLHLNDLWSDTKSKKLNEANRPLTSIQKQVTN